MPDSSFAFTSSVYSGEVTTRASRVTGSRSARDDRARLVADVVDPEPREHGVDRLPPRRRRRHRLEQVEGVHEAVRTEQSSALRVAADVRGQEREVAHRPQRVADRRAVAAPRAARRSAAQRDADACRLHDAHQLLDRRTELRTHRFVGREGVVARDRLDERHDLVVAPEPLGQAIDGRASSASRPTSSRYSLVVTNRAVDGVLRGSRRARRPGRTCRSCRATSWFRRRGVAATKTALQGSPREQSREGTPRDVDDPAGERA